MSAELLVVLVLSAAMVAGLLWRDHRYRRRRAEGKAVLDAGCPGCVGRHTRDLDRWDARYDPPSVAETEGAHSVEQSAEGERIAWLLTELERPDVRELLAPRTAENLATYYRARLAPEPASVAPIPDPVPILATTMVGPHEVAPIGLSGAVESAIAAPTAIPSPSRSVASAQPEAVESPALPPPIAPSLPRPRPWETWDSAVVLLYLGAFLVVAAGLVYSSYNWSSLPGWQKVAMLLTATVGFAGGGFALLRFARVRPAAETFVGIGAFLAPMNVLAARNFLGERALDPFAILEFGAILVAILYGLFSFRPGGLIYRYATLVAVGVAIAALPPALGLPWGWGAVLTAVAPIAVPDAPRLLRGRSRRFARPTVDVGLVALPIAVGAALAAAFLAGQPWAAPAALAAATVTVGRLAIRRELEWLAWLWSALAIATIAAVLLAGARPPIDWTPAVIALAAAWLSLGERGPRLLRRPENRDLLHLEAVALLAVGPVLALADERWLALTLAGVAATAGIACLGRLRAEPLLIGLAALTASATYLSLANVVPDAVRDLPPALTLAACPLFLALVAALIDARLTGRTWALPVWSIAAADAIAVTVVALVASQEPGAGSGDRLVLAGVAATFGMAALCAVRATGRSAILPGALLWFEFATLAALATLPAGFDRTLPLVVLANALLVAFVASPLLDRLVGRGGASVGTRQLAAASPTISGGAALTIMAAFTVQYAGDLRRPPLDLAHPATGWWWSYLGCYLLLAVGGVAAGRRVAAGSAGAAGPWPGRLADFAGAMVGVAALLGLRMLYAEVDLSREHWWLAIAAAGGATAGAGLVWRSRGAGFDRHFASWLAGLGVLYAVPALSLMLIRSMVYALDLQRRAGGDPLPAWWLEYLVGFAALAAAAYWLGRRLGEQAVAPVVAAVVLGLEVLLLRAGYGNGWVRLDRPIWLPIVVAVGALTALGGLAIGRPARNAFGRVLPYWICGTSVLVSLPPLAMMIVMTVAYAVALDEPPTVAAWGAASWWWVFLLLYAVAALGLLFGGRRHAAGRTESGLAVLTAAALTVTIAHAWRIAYGLLPLNRLDWLALGPPLTTLVMAAGLRLRTRGLTLRTARPEPFPATVGKGLAWVGGIAGAVAMWGSTLLSLAFILTRSEPVVASDGWWWRFVALHALVALVAWRFGRAGDRAKAAPVAVGYALLAGWVGLRMATVDLTVWSIAGLATAAGCYLLWTWRRAQASASRFDGWLRRSLAIAGLAFAAVALPGNLALGLGGEADAWVETILFALLTLGVFAAGLWERQPRLAYGAAAALAVAILFAIATADVAPVNAGYAFGALGWLLLGASFVLPTGGQWAGQRSVWVHAGLGFGVLTVLLGLTASNALDPGTAAYGRLTLAVASLAGLLAVAAVALLSYRAILAHAAATLGLCALLMAIAATEPSNVQAYSVPAALYLLGLAWTRRRQPQVFDALVVASAALMMLPPFLQSLAGNGFGWAILCGGEGLLFVFAGLGMDRRAPLAAGIVAVTAVTLRQTVDYVNSLPTWAILALVGMTLLALGTLSLLARDAFLRRVAATRERWGEMR